MQPADVLYNMMQSALKKNEQTLQSLQKSMAERKAQQEAFYAEVAEKNTRKPTAEELKAEEDARRAEAAWNETAVLGHVESEEPGSQEPVKRAVREDADTRSFGLRHEDDEDEAEEPVVRQSRSDDDGWGRGVRKFGNYDEDE